MRLVSIVSSSIAIACLGCSPSAAAGTDGGNVDGGGDLDGTVATTNGGVTPDGAVADGGVDAGPPVPMTIDFRDPEHTFGPPLPSCASPLMRLVRDRAGREALRGSVPLRWFTTHKNSAEPDVLIDGPEIFPRMAREIANARYQVLFQTYVWEQDSEPAGTILRALRELETNRLSDPTRTGPVMVRFLLDTSDISFGSQPIEVAMPELAGALEGLHLDPSAVVWEIGAYTHLALGNLHVKHLVVDGLVGVATGANPQHHHDYTDPWHDTGYVMRGEVAIGMVADFEHAWVRSKRWTCGSTMGDEASCTVVPTEEEHTVLVDPNLEDACLPIMIAMRVADANPASNRTDNTQDQAFLAAFENATDHIRIETPNVNDDAMKAAILGAVERGVQVDIVTSFGFNQVSESVPGQGGPNDQNVDELYTTLSGMFPDACDRFRVRWYSFDGVDAIEGNGPRASHTKYATIDDQIAIIGTANQDTQSWNNSREVNFVVDSAEITRSWDSQLFLPDHMRGIVTPPCD